MILAAVRDDSDASSRSGGLAKHSFRTRSSTATPSLLVGLRDRGSKTAKHGLYLSVVCKSDGSTRSRLRERQIDTSKSSCVWRFCHVWEESRVSQWPNQSLCSHSFPICISRRLGFSVLRGTLTGLIFLDRPSWHRRSHRLQRRMQLFYRLPPATMHLLVFAQDSASSDGTHYGM